MLPKENEDPSIAVIEEGHRKPAKQDKNGRIDSEEQGMVLSSLIIIKWDKKSLNAYEPKAKLIRRVNHPHQATFLEVPFGCKLSPLLDTGCASLQGQRAQSCEQPWSSVRAQKEERQEARWLLGFHLCCSRCQLFH